MASSYIVGLDVGSHSIKAAVGELKKNSKLSLVQLVKMPSAGMRRGLVDDLPEATRAIGQVLAELKKISKSAIKNIYLGVGSPDFKAQSGTGMVAVSRADSEIYQEDIDRVVDAAQAVKIPLGRMIVHCVTNEFVVDGMGGIRDPLGMVGNRLEVRILLIDAFASAIKNLTKCVENAGGDISGLIFSPLATSRALLSKNQKELGVAVLEIGFGKAGVSVYEEGKLLHSAVFPAGSGNATNDLGVGLKVAHNAAENIKLSLGTAIAKEAPAREQVELIKYDSAARGTVSRRRIAEILEARLAEILEFVNNDLKYIGKQARLPAGMVLSGGGVKLPAMVDLARQELKLSAQIGIPSLSEVNIANSDLVSQAEDPEWACAIGLLLSGVDQLAQPKAGGSVVAGWFKRVFNIFTP